MKTNSLRPGALTAAFALFALTARAQVAPAAGPTTPDDTPSIRIGMVWYGDYTYTHSPQQKDADGNTITFSQFNVGRSYLNITGNVSHIVAYRITPDIVRETTAAPTTSGSLVFRIKYAYAQFNLDDWMTRGSWVRLGMQQTPWIDFEENIYRYRFQGPVFSDREGFLSSSDAGASFHYSLPQNYGDIHAGIYNGENYNKAETNNQKALVFRGTVRPFARMDPVLRGVRVTLFYDKDNYVMNAERTRFIGAFTFEHQYVNVGYQYLTANDQTSAVPGTLDRRGRGYSIWATPKQGTGSLGWEGLLRYDRMTPDNRSIVVPPGTSVTYDQQERNRTILGIAYWFPHSGTATAALLFDYEIQTFGPGVVGAATANAPTPAVKKIAVHGLLSF